MKIFEENPEPIDAIVVAADEISQKKILINNLVRSQSITTEL